jgi:hypothetical protein
MYKTITIGYIMLPMVPPQFYHADVSWSLLSIHWYHSNTLNPLLYGICDVRDNLQSKGKQNDNQR